MNFTGRKVEEEKTRAMSFPSVVKYMAKDEVTLKYLFKAPPREK